MPIHAITQLLMLTLIEKSIYSSSLQISSNLDFTLVQTLSTTGYLYTNILSA